jgi:acetyl esterase/lipase
MNRFPLWHFVLFVTALGFAESGAETTLPDPLPARMWRILPVGDSITEGGSSFANWREPLWVRLTAAGYATLFVGTRSSQGRSGPQTHEGHGGKNAEFLATRLSQPSHRTAADIVLLHAGHNHFDHERPVPGIIASHESIIASCRAANPRVVVLVAKVIPSSKLPKYAYLTELNAALAPLAARLDTPESPVSIVDQADGFDPHTDTVADGVHPNAAGAAKMAGKWFEAIRAHLPQPMPELPMPRLVSYKNHTADPLMLHVFDPPPGAPTAPAKGRPAIVFFFGGGWTHGTPIQFYPECRHFAAAGWVAISADYRIAATHGSAPFDAVADAKSALRHLRSKARWFGVDPTRIVAAGASAGGHLAAATACLTGLDDPGDDLRISPRPDALVLWYPVIDNGPGGYGHDRVGERFREFSPIHNLRPGFPPTLVFLGTQDRYVPVATMKRFAREIRNTGGRCEVRQFSGAGHPIYQYRDPSSRSARAVCLAAADEFLATALPHPRK